MSKRVMVEEVQKEVGEVLDLLSDLLESKQELTEAPKKSVKMAAKKVAKAGKSSKKVKAKAPPKKGGKSADGMRSAKKPPAKKAKNADHNPFKSHSHNGPATGLVHGPREVDQTKDWDCHKISPYKQQCKNVETGENKTITIKKGYKKQYNKVYRDWVAKGGKG